MKKLLLLLIAVLTSYASYGQYLVMEDSTEMNDLILTECGDADTITTYVRIAGGSISGNAVLIDSFPSDFVVEGFILNPAITAFQGVGTNQAAILFNTTVLNAQTFGVKVQYLVRTKCGANGSFSARHKLKFQHSVVGVNKQGQDLVSAIKAPVLLLKATSNNNEPNAVAGKTYTRNWRLRNTGTNSKINSYTFVVAYQDGLSFDSLIVDGVGVTPTVRNDSMFYTINKPLREFSEFPGDTVSIQEIYKVDACSKFSLFSTIHATWGCYDAPICKSTRKFASTQVPGTVPNVKVQLLSIKKACFGEWDSVTIGYINEGTGIATNVNMQIDQNYPNEANIFPNSRSIAFIDTASMFIEDKHNRRKFILDSVRMYSVNHSFWPNGIDYAAIVRGSTDSIAAGDTAKVTFRVHRGYYNNSLCDYTDYAINTQVDYQNNCGLVDYVIDKKNLFWEYHRFGGKIEYNGPNYLFFGDTGVFEFTTRPWASYNHYNDNNDYFAAHMVLPPGIIWDLDTTQLDAIYVPNGTSVSADSVYYNKTTRELRIFYKNLGLIRNRRIKPKFYVDCNVPGAGGTQNIKMQFFNVRSIESCGFTQVPISCEASFPIPVICPGPCPRGGISAIVSDFERINFGRPDNNDDGLPDATGVINMNRVEKDKIAPKDTMRFKYKAGVSLGVESPRNGFSHAYIEVKVPSFGERLDYIKSDIFVDDENFIPFTATNLPYTKTTVGNITTFKFDISGSVAGFPVGFRYDLFDTFDFNAYFVYNKDVIENVDADDNHLIETDVYTAIVANPPNDTSRYTCLNLPGNIKVVNVFRGYNSRVTKPVGCESSAMITDFHQSIGNCCSNYQGSQHFRYEYRLFSLLDTVSIRIPDGYKLDSTALIYDYTAGAYRRGAKTIHGVTPSSNNGEYYTFVISNQYTSSGGTLVPSTTGYEWQVKNYITPTCAVPNNDTKDILASDVWKGAGHWDGIDNKGRFTPVYRGQIKNRFSANLSIANYGAVVQQTHENSIEWRVKVQNNSNTSNASNVWVSPSEGTSDITVDSVAMLVGSNYVTLTKSGDLYQIGDIAKNGGRRILKVYAQYAECVPDKIAVFSGWDCEGYPANLAAADGACASANVDLRVVPFNPLIQTDLIERPNFPVTICDTLTWVVSVSQRKLAPAYEIALDMEIPNNGVGAKLLPGTAYKYPYNVPAYVQLDPVDLGGGKFRFNISDSIAQIESQGLNTVDSTPLNEIYVKVRMITDCDFQSGSSVRFNARGESKCGEVLTPDAEFSEIRLESEPNPKLLIASSISGEIRPCNAPVKIDVSVANYELGAVVPLDSVIMILPADSRYISNSTTFTYKPLNQKEPNITVEGGRQRLAWSAFPIAVLDSTVYNFEIQSDENTSCSDDFRFETISKSNYSRACGPTTCENEFTNSYDKKEVPVFKPNLTYTNGTGSVEAEVDTTINPGRADKITASGLMFKNDGNDTANLPVLTYYNDMNFNSEYDAGDVFLAKDTMDPVLPGKDIIYSNTFFFPNQVLTDDTVKIIATQPCNCSDLLVTPTFDYFPLPVEYLYFKARLENNKNSIVEWATTMEINSARFDVYRSVGNPNNFEKIRSIKAAGNSNSIKNYQVMDDVTGLPSGLIYYKLVQIDINGTTNHTDYVSVVKTENDGGKTTKVYPNPAENYITIALDNYVDQDYQLELLDVTGRTVKVFEVPVVDGVARTTIDLSNLPSGVYSLSGLDKNIRLIIKD
jgi:hypothetical protein